MLRRILVPLDGSEISWRALEYAANLAHLSHGSLVILKVVKDEEEELLMPAWAGAVEDAYASIGDTVLNAAYELLESKGIDCTYLLAMDDHIAGSILKTVDSEKCDAIVLGSRGLSPLQGLLRGSVGQDVIEKATVPVILIK